MKLNTDKLMVILSLILVSILLIGSCVVSFRLCDFVYLIVLYSFVTRYILIHKKQWKIISNMV